MARLQHWQIALLHLAPAELNRQGHRIDEEARRLIQRNVGGADSAALMGVAGFARVMAYYEGLGWVDSKNGKNFWTLQASDDRYPLMTKCLRMADLAGLTGDDGKVSDARLDAFVAMQSKGRAATLRDANKRVLYEVVEALKGMAERREAATPVP